MISKTFPNLNEYKPWHTRALEEVVGGPLDGFASMLEVRGAHGGSELDHAPC